MKHGGSLVVYTGSSSCGMWTLQSWHVESISPTGDHPLHWELGVLSHWATREVPVILYCYYSFHFPSQCFLFLNCLSSFLFLAVPCEACKDLSSSTRVEPMPPTVEVWSPNHWTLREFPLITFFCLLYWLNFLERHQMTKYPSNKFSNLLNVGSTRLCSL